MPWTPNNAVHVDAGENTLTADVLGDRLTFVANGTKIAESLVGLPEGRVGIFVGGDGNEVLVDTFRVQVPGRPADVTSASSHAPTPGARNLSTGAAAPTLPAPAAPASPSPDISPGSEAQRMRDLLTALADDLASLLSAFSDGFDGAHSPINDPSSLRQAAARLEEATNKAQEVLLEVERIRNGSANRGR